MEPKHLFWGLAFLKIYSTEEVHCTLFQTTRTTFRKWSWAVVKMISSLKIVRLKTTYNSRFVFMPRTTFILKLT